MRAVSSSRAVRSRRGAHEEQVTHHVLTLAALFAHPDNASVLKHFAVKPATDFVTPAMPSGFDEGGKLFFVTWGAGIAPEATCSAGVLNLMAHEQTARIFALHTGRLTVAVRRPGAGPCVGGTMDGWVDLRGLGPGWALFDPEDEEETLARAHARAAQ